MCQTIPPLLPISRPFIILPAPMVSLLIQFLELLILFLLKSLLVKALDISFRLLLDY